MLHTVLKMHHLTFTAIYLNTHTKKNVHTLQKKKKKFVSDNVIKTWRGKKKENIWTQRTRSCLKRELTKSDNQ